LGLSYSTVSIIVHHFLTNYMICEQNIVTFNFLKDNFSENYGEHLTLASIIPTLKIRARSHR
jgi:hypothetical protein